MLIFVLHFLLPIFADEEICQSLMEKLNVFLFLCISFFMLSLLPGCLVRGTEGRHEPYANLMAGLESNTSERPGEVCAAVDSLLPSVKDSVSYYSLLVLKAKSKLFLAEFDSSEVLLRMAGSFCSRDSSDARVRDLYANVYNMQGNLYGRFAVYDSAVWAFEKAYQCASHAGASEPLLNISLNLADAYIRTGRLDLGSYWYNYALSMADSIRMEEKKRFPIYYGLAQVNMELRDFGTCDYYYDLAAAYFDEMQPYEKHVYLNNRGNSYYYRQDYPKALEYFRRSLALTNSHPEMEFERNLTMVNLGEVFMLMNQTDSASCYLDRCRRFFMENKNLSALYYIDTQMIELALKQGNTSRARHLLSLTKDTEGVELNMIRIRNRYLQHYFEAVGNWRNAYEYQKLNWKIDDSVRNERIKMRSAEIALKYKRDSTLMKQELFIEQKENQVLSLYQWLWGIIVGVLLLGCGALALVFHRKRQREMEQTRLHTAITSLRLENIRNRISPHFIFNLLNREMNLRGDESKNRNLMNLTKLLRRNLELTDKLAVTLADELDFVNTYVALERSALGSDFEFVQEVDSKILPDKVLLPAMMLQIPVENAIKHGLRMKEGKKWLKISLKRRDDVIVMKVCDNGGGYRNRSANRGTGTGMKVITQTIQLLNFYNRRPIVMGITNLQVDDDGTMGCEVKYEVPLDYSYTLKKME